MMSTARRIRFSVRSAEQFAVASDIVRQGVGSIRALADGLKKNDRWDFWWDWQSPAPVSESWPVTAVGGG
jgi:hypothetical protein